jgi:hypothetical protein
MTVIATDRPRPGRLTIEVHATPVPADLMVEIAVVEPLTQRVGIAEQRIVTALPQSAFDPVIAHEPEH